MTRELSARFLEKLELFLFFHLGADVERRVESDEEGLRVSIRHHRVEPFTLAISFERLAELIDDSAALEHFMLEAMTAHRR